MALSELRTCNSSEQIDVKKTLLAQTSNNAKAKLLDAFTNKTCRGLFNEVYTVAVLEIPAR